MSTNSWQRSFSSFSLSRTGPVPVGHIRRTLCPSIATKRAAQEWRERAFSMGMCDEAYISIVRRNDSSQSR